MFGEAACQRRRAADAGMGVGSNEQPLSDKPPLIRCGETFSTWQYKFKFKFLRSTTKRFVLKR